MGGQELIEALRKTAEEQVRRIWNEAETDAGKLKADAERRREELARLANGRPSAEAEEYERSVMRQAVLKARNIRLEAEAALSEGLYASARTSLPSLRQERGSGLFTELASELPALAWKTVRVNPADVDLARTTFPDAEIVPDEQIIGGMDATTQGEAVRVVNSFEKRLERAWPELMPEMMKDVHEQTGNNEPSVGP